MDRQKLDQNRLAVARHAADLFWQNGVEKTSGDAIAAAAGLSKRTVWRYFRSKEACIEPLFRITGLRFIELLQNWPDHQSIETYLHDSLGSMLKSDQDIRDGIAVARLISRITSEPAIRSAYLMASAEAEDDLVPILARRSGRRCDDIDVRVCAASAMAAVRVIDADISIATFSQGRVFTHAEVCSRLAAAIRSVASLPVCDPVSSSDDASSHRRNPE
ncbi:helix-turn-helix domain-containing protein [Pseudotabrizicola sp. 4114]|uniref:TetR/AcrR family transcriptional regulator n=1 Tax=Pseudotabrizicola sp. 4114 TaxID=2817731 RepID=UPI00285E028A|nr:AcrR family transcriptional regulator [Pseudorhodobacter sp. 4114]